MKALIQHVYGDAAKVLQRSDIAAPRIASGTALVRTLRVPIHHGDLLAVRGSSAFGDADPLPEEGRVPGLEGMGVIESLPKDASGSSVKPGTRVAFFPVAGTWREKLAVPLDVLVPLPDAIPDDIAARLLIDTVTALLIVRATLGALPASTDDVAVLQTAAGSSVGRLVTALMRERGVSLIRLGNSAAGLARLQRDEPDVPVVASQQKDWKASVRDLVGTRKLAVAIDGVGGDLLGDVGGLIEPGGTLLNYGTLGGERADIRPLVPRRLTLRGISVAAWFDEPAAQRDEDIATALRLAVEKPHLFDVAASYPFARFADAIERLGAAGRSGSILIDFTGDDA